LATLGGVIVVGGSLLAAGGDASAVQTTFMSVGRGDVTALASAAGTVQSGRIRELGFGTSGIVTKLNVQAGQKVQAGKVIAQLDSTQATEDVSAAVAALAAANAKYDQATASPSPSASSTKKKPTCTSTGTTRKPAPTPTPTKSRTPTPSPGPTRTTASPSPAKTRTVSVKAAPKSTCGTGSGNGTGNGGGGSPRPSASATQNKAVTKAQASASVVKAQVTLDQARRALAGTTLTAPTAGTVLTVSGVVGSKVSGPGSTGFVTLGNLDELQVEADFSQSDVAKLAVGQSAKITLPAGNGGPYDGTVAHIEPSATTSGTLVQYGVMISFNDTPENLLIGQSATVQVTTSKADDTIQVPTAALRTGTDGNYTVLVKHGTGIRTRVVKVGLRGDSYVQIVSGLKAGDKIKI
jgi:HlyD family secretion protein